MTELISRAALHGRVVLTDHSTRPAKGWQQAAERMLQADLMLRGVEHKDAPAKTEFVAIGGRKTAATYVPA
ncbi:MAG TPA: hypothetical protein VK165_09475 [Azonexus sp.]|nr:hypothetical protein [Azonexus sp.]